ncbi:hypothetical protein M2451_000119 [Dysgonomonas sp. PFB1-18]|uniref:hypothetical protein n=1 Tax=unclassified Dysgonomonas TaxID=2630389 RepID=UPI002475E943|nr:MULTISPECIES: hypothetical protein [unclassified Dysgonomonas]MDH6307670.1 hypothetical protein [Dysgonomonas sp. PF1-14]MDH6337588.1 hypothetical protein [Dysgonomonas sp. PF1-16]MDH6378812.1 hypothetical protein [Dysgonomonas sp. PFB1-18]MDH6396447.1 hypothetical protein [Dysgonomonas sp. PF1-23]
MKHINFLLLIALATCFVYQASAQSRSAATGNLKIEKQSEKLRIATGWKQDISGNWISNVNAISDTKLDEQSLSTAPQNFKWLQFVLLKNGNQNIYTLLYENTAYLSSSKNERRVNFYLMTDQSYLKIVDAVKQKNGETLTIHATSYGYMSDSDGDFSSTKLMNQITQSIAANNGDLYDFSVNAQYVDNEDVVRFRIPEKTSIMSGSLVSSYFEVKLSDFENILLPAPVVKNADEFSLDAPTPDKVREAGTNAATPVPVVIAALNDDIVDRVSAEKAETKTDDFSISNDAQQVVNVQYADTISAEEPVDELADRQVKERAVVSEPVAVFSGIEGWYHTSEGEWVNDKNHQYDFETVGRYELRNFSYHRKNYLLLVRYEKYAGENYYLISRDDYTQTMQDMEKSSMLKFPVIVQAGLGYSFQDMIELCEKTLDTPVKKDAVVFKRQYLVMQYKLSKAKDVARFFIFLQSCSRYGAESSPETCNIVVSNKVRYADESLLMTDGLFGKAYYESSFSKFMDFFRKPLPAGALPVQNQEQF